LDRYGRLFAWGWKYGRGLLAERAEREAKQEKEGEN